jgi:NTE family protein
MTGRALVLGGGGVTGVAWELGILAGLAEAGLDLGDADLIIGTSAGSVVAAQLTSGRPIADLYAGQLEPPANEVPARLGLGLLLRYAAAAITSRDPQRGRVRIGRLALRAKTLPEAERRAVIESRLVATDWPVRPRVVVTAVATDDGEFVTFDRDSGVSLVDAVGASCAVPGVWPPVTINGRRYMDGGMRAPANVDLAAGSERVVVLAPLTSGLRRDMTAAVQLAALPGQPAQILVAPDPMAVRAIGRNVLDPARREGAARPGYDQAARVLDQVKQVWQD